MYQTIISNGKHSIVITGHAENRWDARLYVNCTGHYSQHLGTATQQVRKFSSLPKARAWAEKEIGWCEVTAA